MESCLAKISRAIIRLNFLFKNYNPYDQGTEVPILQGLETLGSILDTYSPGQMQFGQSAVSEATMQRMFAQLVKTFISKGLHARHWSSLLKRAATNLFGESVESPCKTKVRQLVDMVFPLMSEEERRVFIDGLIEADLVEELPLRILALSGMGAPNLGPMSPPSFFLEEYFKVEQYSNPLDFDFEICLWLRILQFQPRASSEIHSKLTMLGNKQEENTAIHFLSSKLVEFLGKVKGRVLHRLSSMAEIADFTHERPSYFQAVLLVFLAEDLGEITNIHLSFEHFKTLFILYQKFISGFCQRTGITQLQGDALLLSIQDEIFGDAATKFLASSQIDKLIFTSNLTSPHYSNLADLTRQDASQQEKSHLMRRLAYNFVKMFATAEQSASLASLGQQRLKKCLGILVKPTLPFLQDKIDFNLLSPLGIADISRICFNRVTKLRASSPELHSIALTLSLKEAYYSIAGDPADTTSSLSDSCVSQMFIAYLESSLSESELEFGFDLCSQFIDRLALQILNPAMDQPGTFGVSPYNQRQPYDLADFYCRFSATLNGRQGGLTKLQAIFILLHDAKVLDISSKLKKLKNTGGQGEPLPVQLQDMKLQYWYSYLPSADETMASIDQLSLKCEQRISLKRAAKHLEKYSQFLPTKNIPAAGFGDVKRFLLTNEALDLPTSISKAVISSLHELPQAAIENEWFRLVNQSSRLTSYKPTTQDKHWNYLQQVADLNQCPSEGESRLFLLDGLKHFPKVFKLSQEASSEHPFLTWLACFKAVYWQEIVNFRELATLVESEEQKKMNLIQSHSSYNKSAVPKITTQNLKSIVVQTLIEILSIVHSTNEAAKTSQAGYELCQVIHSILVEDPDLIYHIHYQTYPLLMVPAIIENVESIHIVSFEMVPNLIKEFIESLVKVAEAFHDCKTQLSRVPQLREQRSKEELRLMMDPDSKALSKSPSDVSAAALKELALEYRRHAKNLGDCGYRFAFYLTVLMRLTLKFPIKMYVDILTQITEEEILSQNITGSMIFHNEELVEQMNSTINDLEALEVLKPVMGKLKEWMAA